jgi:hypothetical protein
MIELVDLNMRKKMKAIKENESYFKKLVNENINVLQFSQTLAK